MDDRWMLRRLMRKVSNADFRRNDSGADVLTRLEVTTSDKQSTTRILVSHPAYHHVHEVVMAALEAGFQTSFITSLYRTGKGISSDGFLRRTPSPVRRAIIRWLSRRWHPEIPVEVVVTVPTYHLLGFALRWTAKVPGLRRLDATRWADKAFDAHVAGWLREIGEVFLIHAFESGALATFRAAKQVGSTTILDVPSAHEYYIRELADEGDSTPSAVSERVRAERDLADYMLAPSDYVVQCLLEHNVAAEKIIKLPYGVDPARFVPPPVEKPDGTFRALFVGQIGLRKGVRYLLEAWRRLGLPDSELLLVGGADARGMRILRAYGGIARWIGPMPKYEVQRIFAESDVFTFPSLAEGSAYVTYEAMASGLPVITTPNSGSVVRDRIDGLIVPSRDVDSLCNAILYMYRNPSIRKRMGREARQLIQRSYSWKHYRQRLGRVYHAIANGEDPTVVLSKELI